MRFIRGLYQSEARHKFTGQAVGVVAPDGQPAALLRTRQRKRRNDSVPTDGYCLGRCIGVPPSFRVIDEKVKHRAVVPRVDLPIVALIQHISDDPLDRCRAIAQPSFAPLDRGR